jgi:hypothetical protein
MRLNTLRERSVRVRRPYRFDDTRMNLALEIATSPVKSKTDQWLRRDILENTLHTSRSDRNPHVCCGQGLRHLEMIITSAMCGYTHTGASFMPSPTIATMHRSLDPFQPNARLQLACLRFGPVFCNQRIFSAYNNKAVGHLEE